MACSTVALRDREILTDDRKSLITTPIGPRPLWTYKCLNDHSRSILGAISPRPALEIKRRFAIKGRSLPVREIHFVKESITCNY